MIARLFKELGWVEELGSGKKNIRKYAPFYYDNCEIEIDNAEKFIFSITYRNTDKTIQNEHVKLTSEHVNTVLTTTQINSIYEMLDEKVDEKITEPFKLYLFKIVAYLLNNKGANGKELAIISGKGRSSLTRHLKLLRDSHIIEFIGSDKTGGYYLTAKVKEKLQIS